MACNLLVKMPYFNANEIYFYVIWLFSHIWLILLRQQPYQIDSVFVVVVVVFDAGFSQLVHIQNNKLATDDKQLNEREIVIKTSICYVFE